MVPRRSIWGTAAAADGVRQCQVIADTVTGIDPFPMDSCQWGRLAIKKNTFLSDRQ